MSELANRSPLGVLLAWGILAALSLGVSITTIRDSGLYYDEAFLAQQGRDFAEPERAGVHAPSVRTAYLAGRPFPIRNATYLGSLKSQLLIPSFALFDADKTVLRISTQLTALIALLFAMLLARRVFGAAVAISMGVLVAADPSFHFLSHLEWGPFSTLLLCRCLGLYLLYVGFTSERPAIAWGGMLSGGLILGLGVYARADFAVILAAACVAVLLCRRELIGAALGARRGPVIGGALLLVLGASPMLMVVPDLFGAGAGMADRGGLDYRMDVLISTLNGSHFHRFVEAGGLFDLMFESAAPGNIFVPILLVCVVILVLVAKSTPEPRSAGFVIVTGIAITLGMLLLPGAVRVHHMLNSLPLPQLVVAAAGVGLWQHPWSSRASGIVSRASVVVVLALLLASDAVVIARTRALIAESGGRGRVALVLDEFAAQLDAREDAAQLKVVSLDWGFHENLLFSTRNIQLQEPIWAIPAALRMGQGIKLQGDAKTLYLVHPESHDLVGVGADFLRAIRALDPKRIEIEHFDNREGERIFTSVRFDAPHEFSYNGSFRIRFQ